MRKMAQTQRPEVQMILDLEEQINLGTFTNDQIGTTVIETDV